MFSIEPRMNTFVHIIEYPNRGTLWRLMSDLCIFDNHNVVETRGNQLPLGEFRPDSIYIIHTSGRPFPVINSLWDLRKQGIRCAVFIHTSPEYIVLKGMGDFLTDIRQVQNALNLLVLVPSRDTQEKFAKYGIVSKVCQLGIGQIIPKEPYRDINYLFDRVITVCTNEKTVYKKAKGIDLFCNIIKEFGIQDQAVILGVDGKGEMDGILREKLTHEEFVWILSHSRMYVQLSRQESYNITAIEAKRLKIPLLVSDVDGHKDCVTIPECRANLDSNIMQKFQSILYSEISELSRILLLNYNDSIERQSVSCFRNAIEDAYYESNLHQ